MKAWRVTFDAEGAITELVEIEGPADVDWVVVHAANEESARVKAVRKYHAQKQKERRARLHAEGRCRCSRIQDRPGFKTCSVCANDRQKQHEKRKAVGFEPRTRDEEARVEAFLETNRERRQSLRLEVLLEVKRWWREADHTEAFARKLATEILDAGGSAGQTSTLTAKLAS